MRTPALRRSRPARLRSRRSRSIIRVMPSEQLHLYRFAHPPEERQWPLHDAGNVLTPSLMAQPEAERRKDDVVEGGLVDAARGGLFLIGRFGLEPGCNLGFDTRVFWPSEPCVIAAGAEMRVGYRNTTIGACRCGVEQLP